MRNRRGANDQGADDERGDVLLPDRDARSSTSGRPSMQAFRPPRLRVRFQLRAESVYCPGGRPGFKDVKDPE